MLSTVVDTAFRVPHFLRGYHQFTLVFADIGHTILDRDNRFQSQTARRTLEIPTYVFAHIQKNVVSLGASSSILSGISRRYRRQQRGQIYSLAIRAT